MNINKPLITLSYISKLFYTDLKKNKIKDVNSFSTALLLNYIYNSKEVNSQELYLTIPQSNSAIIYNLNYLIAKGYIIRLPKKINRSHIYQCTNIGKSLIKECEAKKPKKPYVRNEYRTTKN